MEFSDLVKKRGRATDFLEKPIEQKKLAVIVDAATRAPSSGDLQSYKIYAVLTKELIEEIGYTSEDELVNSAAVLLVFCADLKHSEELHAENSDFYSSQDATIAATYAELAAFDQGISCSWLIGFEPLEISRIIKAGSYQVPVAVLALGYASSNDPVPRRPFKDIVREV